MINSFAAVLGNLLLSNVKSRFRTVASNAVLYSCEPQTFSCTVLSSCHYGARLLSLSVVIFEQLWQKSIPA